MGQRREHQFRENLIVYVEDFGIEEEQGEVVGEGGLQLVEERVNEAGVLSVDNDEELRGELLALSVALKVHYQVPEPTLLEEVIVLVVRRTHVEQEVEEYLDQIMGVVFFDQEVFALFLRALYETWPFFS